MADQERGRRLLQELAQKVRDKTTPQGDPQLNQRGLDMVEALARDLTGAEGFPGLHLFRDSAERFRLQRERKNAEVTVEWFRDIGAIELGGERNGSRPKPIRYLYDEPAGVWRRMTGGGDLYEDLVLLLTEFLYPEVR
ncbi:MAG: hypothetical protein HY909_22105 [Deltaproteobacteria bacterium]|nr:hypothetical protein [Deltaproteobacteria bacterium]